jgi:transcriptional regulator
VYVPPAFREERREVLHDLIRQHAFGTLVSALDGELFATHLPFLLDAGRGEHGTLLGHMARANPHWRAFAVDATGATGATGTDALVVFQGPHAYVSPSWYATELAVPTWNYVAVHAAGRPRLLEDEAALRALLEQTTREYEAPAERPWDLQRLPEELTAALVRNVVGFEIPIRRLEGKWKLNQNRSVADRRGVVAALRRQGDPLGAGVAALMAAGLEPDA